jgi:hypothetical protein
MSSKPKGNGGFNPAPPTKSYSLEELEEIGSFFKRLIDESNLRWAVVAAGIAAIAEILHICWLAIRYLFHF